MAYRPVPEANEPEEIPQRRLVVRLDLETSRSLKLIAVAEDTTMEKLARDAIAKLVQKRNSQNLRRR